VRPLALAVALLALAAVALWAWPSSPAGGQGGGLTFPQEFTTTPFFRRGLEVFRSPPEGRAEELVLVDLARRYGVTIRVEVAPLPQTEKGNVLGETEVTEVYDDWRPKEIVIRFNRNYPNLGYGPERLAQTIKHEIRHAQIYIDGANIWKDTNWTNRAHDDVDFNRDILLRSFLRARNLTATAQATLTPTPTPTPTPTLTPTPSPTPMPPPFFPESLWLHLR